MSMTIREAHIWASSFLKENHIEQENLEAEILIREIQNWTRAEFFMHIHDTMENENLMLLKKWLNRRVEHEPLQYIVGKQEFYGREFLVNSHVLIPRPETEILVEQVIKESRNIWNENRLVVADIGSGSGAIAVTMALEQKEWNILSVDISKEAIEMATLNAKRLGAKVQFYQGDMLTPIINEDIGVDIIISNPPYIPSKEIQQLSNEVKDYEPNIALDGGTDGLDFYRKIVKQSKNILHKPGMIAFEVGINQAKLVSELLIGYGYTDVKIVRDLQGIARIVFASNK